MVFIKAKQRRYKRLRPPCNVSCKGVALRERQLADRGSTGKWHSEPNKIQLVL